MGTPGKRISPTIEAFVVNTKRNAPGLTYPNIADRVVERFGEASRIDRSSVQRILARAGIQGRTMAGVAGNLRGIGNESMNYQGSSGQPDPEHRRTLLAPLLDLKEVQPMGMHDYDLAIWHSRSNLSSWPLAKGQVCRSPSRTLEVRLDIESRMEYRYLRQHLPDDLIWSALEAFRQMMAHDIAARLTLLEKVTALVERPEAEGGTGLTVIPDLDFGTEKEAVSSYYVFTIHDQVLSRCLGLNHAAKERREFSREAPNLTRLGSYTVISGPDEGRHTRLIELLLKAQEEWTDLPEAGAAAEAYRLAEAATSEVRQQLDRLRLAVGFPTGSRCQGCDWETIAHGRDSP